MKNKLKGRKYSEETKRKISVALKGQKCINKGKKWFTNDIINVMSFDQPEGFKPGRAHEH